MSKLAAKLMCLLLAISLTSASSLADFKQVTIVVGFSPGGGNDTYARLLARHIKNHLAGIPTIIVRNMPGGGSLNAVKYLDIETKTSPSEVTMTAFNYGLITTSLLEPDRASVNFSEFGWVGSMANVLPVCFAWHTTGVKDWADVMKRDSFVVGAPAAGSSNYINAVVLKQVLHGPIKIVTGYSGSAAERLAIERGELDGGCGGWNVIPPNWLADKKIVPLLTFSSNDQDVAQSGYKVPYIGDLVKDEKDLKLMNFFIGPATVGRPFIVSKSIPKNDLETLRLAFDKTMQDAELIAEAKRLKLPLAPTTGAASQAVVAQIYSTPSDVVGRAREIMK